MPDYDLDAHRNRIAWHAQRVRDLADKFRAIGDKFQSSQTEKITQNIARLNICEVYLAAYRQAMDKEIMAAQAEIDAAKKYLDIEVDKVRAEIGLSNAWVATAMKGTTSP
jgi:hypothetical protein